MHGGSGQDFAARSPEAVVFMGVLCEQFGGEEQICLYSVWRLWDLFMRMGEVNCSVMLIFKVELKFPEV